MAATVVRLAMETYGLIVLFAVLGVSLAKTDKPELEIHPAGLIKQGDNITISCSVRKDRRLDFIRIVRNIDAAPYEISTNKMLKSPFLETGRYRIAKYKVNKDGVTEIKLQIDNIQGRDGGNIGCLLLPKEAGASEDLKVHVPPKSVKLIYLLEDGTEVEVPSGGTLQMRHGVESAIMCRIYQDGDNKPPKIGITFDGKDMTQTFIKDYTSNDGADEDGFLSLTYNATYKYMTDRPDKDNNGKQVTCSAQMKHFPPVSTKAKLEILYPPELKCKKRLYAKEGTPDVKIACKGKMHPAPITSVWTFGNGKNKTTLESGQEQGAFVAVKESLGGDEYELSITIKEVEEEHFCNYHIQVTNGIGEKQSLVRLVKEEESNAGRDSIAGRDGTNPSMNAEEMLVHGNAVKASTSWTGILIISVFMLGMFNRGL